MKRSILNLSFPLFAFAGFLLVAGCIGCSSKSSQESKKAARAPDKIQGKALVITETASGDAAMNAGGPTVYLVDGLHRYRLFFNTATNIDKEKHYVAEGIYAQKAIEEMGDPDQGKNGYPLPDRCEQVVHMAWSGLALDISAGDAEALCEKIKRYPARAIFLVQKVELAPGATAEDQKKEEDEEDDAKAVSVPADKARASMIQGPPVQAAPLFDPAATTVSCKVLIDEEGKISKLETGNQLCESAVWDQVRFKPTVEHGHPVKVKTEVEVKFEPRK